MISAAELAKALGGRRYGRQWQARCPAHDDHNPSLSVCEGDDGRILVHRHAGCEQGAVIDALVSRGLWLNDDHSYDRVIAPERKRESDVAAAQLAATLQLVERIWREAVDPLDTPAERYLQARKLCLPPELRVIALRFHPACVWESGTAPCLIAAFRTFDGDKLSGIHRIRVDQPQRWPKTERKMLGNITGSAVKLDPASEALAVGEGVETCMAARQLGLRPIWVLGSAGAIARFPQVANIERLSIAGENDGGASRQAAEACRDHWHPRRVAVLMPTGGLKDFNDYILEKTK
jgi:putative DNA primase/helicase